VATERLKAVETLQSAVGERLAAIAATAAAARQAMPGDPAQARAKITAAGAAARETIARARALTASGSLTQQNLAAPSAGGAVIGGRLAWTVLVVVLPGYGAAGLNDAIADRIGLRLIVLLAVGTILGVALQLHHSWAARQRRKPPGMAADAGRAGRANIRILPAITRGIHHTWPGTGCRRSAARAKRSRHSRPGSAATTSTPEGRRRR